MMESRIRQIQLEKLEQLMPLIREQLEQGHSVRFYPMGESMLPMLRQGKDSVVLSPVPEKLKKYDLPLYRRQDGKYVLHRIVETGETFSCMGDNQFVMETGLEKAQMIALVTGFYRDGKYCSANSRLYRFYCRVWHNTRPWRKLLRRMVRKIRRILV